MTQAGTATFKGTIALFCCLILAPIACQVREAGDETSFEMPTDPSQMVIKAEAMPLSEEKNSYGVMVSWTMTEPVILVKTEMRRTVDGPIKSDKTFEFTGNTQQYLDKEAVVGHSYTYQLKAKDGRTLPENFTKTTVKIPTDGTFINAANFKTLLGTSTWHRFYLDENAKLLPGEYVLDVEEFHAEKNATFDLTGEGAPKLILKARKAKGYLTVKLPFGEIPPLDMEVLEMDKFSIKFEAPDGQVADNVSIVLKGRRYIKMGTEYKPIQYGLYEDTTNAKARIILITPLGERHELAITNFFNKDLFSVDPAIDMVAVRSEAQMPTLPYQKVDEDGVWLTKSEPYLGLVRLRQVMKATVKLNEALTKQRLQMVFSYGRTRQEFSQTQVELMNLLYEQKDRLISELKERKVRTIEINNWKHHGDPFMDNDGALVIPPDIRGKTAEENMELLIDVVRAYKPGAKPATPPVPETSP